MNFENDDKIQWYDGEASLTDEVNYLNPPEFFRLRGVRYRYCRLTQEKVGGTVDGEKWHAAQKTDNGENSEYVWVCESKPGEFVQVFIPLELKDAPYVA